MMSVGRRATPWISGIALLLLYALVTGVPDIRAADRSAFSGRLDGSRAFLVIEHVALSTITAATLLLCLVMIAAIGYLRRGLSLAVRIVGSVVGAVVSAELLKHFLPTGQVHALPGRVISGGSFPSGHATIAAAVTLAFAATLGPRAARLWRGPLVAWASLVAAATVAAGWHRPSDAVGGVLMAVIWHASLAHRPAAPATTEHLFIKDGTRQNSMCGIPALGWWVATSLVILVFAHCHRRDDLVLRRRKRRAGSTSSG